MKFSLKESIELIGIFSIVVSLIFVGYELRQNSAISRFESFTTISLSLTEYNQNLASDDHLAALFTRVYSGAMPSDFSEKENIQINLQYQALLRIWDSLFRAVDEEILSARYLDLVGRAGAFNNPYFAELWFQNLGGSFTPEFVTFFESLGRSASEQPESI